MDEQTATGLRDGGVLPAPALRTGRLTDLRDIRLGRARRELRGSGPAAVAAVAHGCGFTHLSRFAQDYRARYGELPSETARGPRER